MAATPRDLENFFLLTEEGFFSGCFAPREKSPAGDFCTGFDGKKKVIARYWALRAQS